MNIRCYDNGGKTADRYTVIYMNEPEKAPNTFAARGMSAHPCDPQGIGMMCTAMPGRHLGKRIEFEELPKDCQWLVKADLNIGAN